MNLPEKDKWNSPKEDVQYDPGFVAYLGFIFDPRRPCVDIGANVGKVSRFLAMRTRCRVTSFEPGLSTFEALSSNLAGLENVALVNKAVGSKSGPRSFVGDGTVTAHLSDGQRGSVIVVDVTTLDEAIPDSEDVGTLKIDVEGDEMAVLIGAEKTIRRTKPLVAIEVIDGHLKRAGATRADIFRMMGRYGYVRAVNKYGMTESPGKHTGACDVFFLPHDGWYAPNISIGYERLRGRVPAEEGA